MKKFSPGVFRTLAALLSLGVAAAVVTLIDASQQPATRTLETNRKMAAALSRHLNKLRQAIPGDGGELGGGGAEDEKFMAKAYPDTDIPLELLEEARAAAARIGGKNFPTGKGRPGTWVTIGPSNALYPATMFRSSYSYVPNDYVAGGRATAVAIDPNCAPGNCRLWVFAAGGGVWRTKNALSGQPSWQFLSGGFGMNSGSSITIDPNDSSGDTLYVGTGEANASGDSAAGVGMYKSTDGGDTWTGPLGAAVFAGRAIGTIAVVPGNASTIYAGTTRGVAGISSVNGGGTTLIPGAAPWGLYKSTDGGTTWTFVHNGSAAADSCDTVSEAIAGGSPCSLRGVRRVAVDPNNPNIVYSGAYSRGIWRSTNGGATWVQIKPSMNALNANMRPEFAVTSLGAQTRMYVHEGATGGAVFYSRLFRSDDAAGAAPVFTDLSSPNPALPGYATYNLCGGQCWYDNFVYTPAGHPDVVYVGGSYAYGEQFSNKRGVVLSTDAGVSATDMTMDGTDFLHPNGLHPDQQALVTNPNNPFQFFEVNDGGVMRSSGEFSDVSSWCSQRDLVEPQLSRCQQLLSRVPSSLEGMNRGLSTLQFQSISVSPFNVNVLQGGTQDNGTWQTPGNPTKWENTMIGDGGQSGFDIGLSTFRFHTFFAATPDVNFSNGDIADWNWIGDPIYGTEPQSFYVPIISDPAVSKSMYVGTGHVWRTKTWGMGTMSLAEFRQHCNEWFGDFTVICGDWLPLGNPTTAGRLGSTAYGPDRAGGFVAAVERATQDASTLWAATQTGRVFISKNANAEPASSVTFIRLDSLALNDPNRFVSGIYVDPANANHAWISYQGFNGTTPGHVFSVSYSPITGGATWTDMSYDLGNIPINDIVSDDVNGDLYAASDFGVFRLVSGTTDWTAAAPGMPNVEVAGLAMKAGARKLIAATHGLGAWLLNLP